MADNNTQSQFSYIGKTPLLRPLNNLSGQFFLFSQYAEDLTEYLGNNAGEIPVPTTFYALKVDLPNKDTHSDHNGEVVFPEDGDVPMEYWTVQEEPDIAYFGTSENHIVVYKFETSSDVKYSLLNIYDSADNLLRCISYNGTDTDTRAITIDSSGEFLTWSILENGNNDTIKAYFDIKCNRSTLEISCNHIEDVTYDPEQYETADTKIQTDAFGTQNPNILIYGNYSSNEDYMIIYPEVPNQLTINELTENTQSSESAPDANFIDPSKEDEIIPGPNPQKTYLQALEQVYCKEIKYKGNINITGKDNVDGINYNEIYCHIDNDAHRQKFRLNLSDNIDIRYGKNNVIGYCPEVPDQTPYQFDGNYGDLIGQILQNEYENGNTFFKINRNTIEWDRKYSLGRLLYVLYKNEMIHFSLTDTGLYDDEPSVDDYINDSTDTTNVTTDTTTETPEQQNIIASPRAVEDTIPMAGVLPAKALFDSWNDTTPERGEYRFFTKNEIDAIDITPEKIKFDFNCIIVCYSHKNMTTGEFDNEEIPMGIYFTGFEKNPNDDEDLGDFTNTFTKYAKNLEIYNQGTSYTLRICMRTIASQATEQGAERIVDVISASNTGEWLNEYEYLMSKFDETNNTLEQSRQYFADMNNNVLSALQIFRNGRTNVPYIEKVNGLNYWFVNGTNTWVRVIEPSDYADWNTERVLPTFRIVNLSVDNELTNCTITPNSQYNVYAGSMMSYQIVPETGYAISEITVTADGALLETYDVTSITDWDEQGIYTDSDNNITIKRSLDDIIYYYTLTFTDIQYNYNLSATATTINE